MGIDDAVRCLDEGRLVLLPTETVFGLAGRADRVAAIEALRSLGNLASEPLTWHAASRDDVTERLGEVPAVHARLLRRFLPGPVRFIIELDADRLAALRQSLGVGAGVIDDGSGVHVRVPSLGVTQRVLEAVNGPVVIIRASAAGLDHLSLDRLGQGGFDERIGCVIPGGGLHAQGSTTVRLREGGAFAIERVGAIAEATIMQAAERLILFVCTGNTCRSPMAAAMARAIVGTSRDDLTTVGSAGTSTADGMGAAYEAIETMRRQGLDLTRHRTRLLTRDLCAAADVIYVMTASHRARVLEIDPSADGKTMLLDPAGDIEDPVGLPLAAYEATAARMRTLIEQRLKESGI